MSRKEQIKDYLLEINEIFGKIKKCGCTIDVVRNNFDDRNTLVVEYFNFETRSNEQVCLNIPRNRKDGK